MYSSTYERLGLHVGASVRDVIRSARRKLPKRSRRGRQHREARHVYLRSMIYHHTLAGRLYVAMTRGMI